VARYLRGLSVIDGWCQASRADVGRLPREHPRWPGAPPGVP